MILIFLKLRAPYVIINLNYLYINFNFIDDFIHFAAAFLYLNKVCH